MDHWTGVVSLALSPKETCIKGSMKDSLSNSQLSHVKEIMCILLHILDTSYRV